MNHIIKSIATKLRKIENAYSSVIFILFLSLSSFYFIQKDLLLNIAYHGYSPIEYVNKKISPNQYISDFPSGTENYDRSLITKSYYFFEKYLKIQTKNLLNYAIFFQCLFYLTGINKILNCLELQKNSKIIFLLLSLISPLIGLNLARFGEGFGSLIQYPIFYPWALGLCFYSFAYVLEQKYWFGTFCNILCFFVHPIFAIICIFSTLFFVVKFSKSHLSTFFIFLILLCVYFLYYIFFSKSPSEKEVINFQNWHSMTRYFGEHWYPFDRKAFSRSALQEFIPLCLLILNTVLIYKTSSYFSRKKSLLFRYIFPAFIILTLIGIKFSSSNEFFLIQLNLIRASGFLSFFCMIFICDFLIKNSSFVIEKIAVSLILSLGLFYKTSFCILASCLIFYFFFKKHNQCKFFLKKGFLTNKRIFN